MFYPGDWIKDPSLRRCSKAAKGVWIDMLCLMFECPVRGVLAGDSAWSDREIAEAIGGDTGTNLECIAELLGKAVARRNSAGAIFSPRMVRDEETRQATKQRVVKHRSNASVTVIETVKKRSCTEDEYVTEKESEFEVGFEVQNPPIDFNMAGRRVFEECGLAGIPRLVMVTDAVRAYCKLKAVDPGAASVALIELQTRYEREITGPFKCRVYKFFESGLWQHPDKWQELARGSSKDGMDGFFKKYRENHAGD